MLLLLLAGVGCDDHVTFASGSLGLDDDDDATASPDDDDATGDDDDDDDAVADDDDAVADDDDASGDDDDTTPPEPGFVGEVYCLDWGSVDVIEPDGLLDLLTGLSDIFDASPPVLIPTAVDVAAEEIEMDAGVTDEGCAAANVFAVDELTREGPGTYVAPHFEAGPGEMNLGGSVVALPLKDALVTGDFTTPEDAIVNGTLSGFLDLSDLLGACALITCGPCPGGGGNDCVAFSADSAVWNRAD